MTNPNPFFEMIKSLYSKSDIPYDDKVFNSYLVIWWLSHDPDSLKCLENIAKYLFLIKPEYIWQYLRHKLPYNRNKFLKHVKKDKLDNDELIESLCNEFNISKLEASYYV